MLSTNLVANVSRDFSDKPQALGSDTTLESLFALLETSDPDMAAFIHSFFFLQPMVKVWVHWYYPGQYCQGKHY